MNNTRMGQIALVVLKYRISLETKLADLAKPISKSDIGRIAKAISINADELVEFMIIIRKETLSEALAKLYTTDKKKM